jgi:CheY-like chemotaxis protein
MSRSQHVLVVEDDREIRTMVMRFLQKKGYRVTVVEDGRAMDRARETARFDLIVLDIMLPGEDGLSICRRLRAQSSVPVIMLTAAGELTARVVGLEMGADDYIAKPFDPQELLARVRDLAMSSGSRRAERAVEPARSENSTVSCLRSASACGEGPGSSEAAPAGDTGGIVVCAAKTRLRSPSVKPSSRRSASVSDASTSRSMPFSRNVASSRDRPTRASHSWIVTETPLQRTAISRVPTDLIALYHPARSPSRELLEDDRALGSCSARLRLLSLLLAPERTWTFGAFYPGHDVWRFFLMFARRMANNCLSGPQSLDYDRQR